MSANQGVLLRSFWRPAKTLCKERNLIGHEDSCLTNGIFYPGLFQASLVISYTTYLTWSALSHEPDDLCNPPGYFISGYDQNTGLSLQGIVSGVFLFLMLIYASFSTAISASKLSKFTCRMKSILSKRPFYTFRGNSYLSSNSFSRVVLRPKYGYECL